MACCSQVDEVADIVEYARARGIRVMAELDTPGHAGTMCRGYPDICPSPICPEPLNPANEDTFTLLSGVLNDMMGSTRGKGLFPDGMFHLGGDEVGNWR